MENNIFLPTLFLITCLAIGIFQGNSVRTFEGYALSRGYFASTTIFFTIVASFIGGGSILGTIGKSYSHGFFPFFALCGFVLQLILNSIIIPKHITKFKGVMTTGDIFDKCYGHWAKKIIALLWMFFSMGVLAVQIRAMGEMLSFYTALSLQNSIYFGGAVLIAYCTFGGVRAVVYTDILQVLVMFIVFPMVLYFISTNFITSDNFIQKISYAVSEQPSLWSKPALLSAFIGFLAGDALVPPVMQRILLVSNPSQIKKTFFSGAIGVLFFVLIATMIGIALSNVAFPEGVKDTTGLMLFAMPDTVRPIVALGILAVVISSADSYLNASSVQVTKDLIGTNKLSTCRWVTFIIGATALAVSIYVNNLFDMLLFAYKFWGPVVIVPLVAIIIGKPLSEQQLKYSIFLSVTSVLMWTILNIEEITGISDVPIGILFSSSYYCYTRVVLLCKNLRRRKGWST